jgi:DNA-binding LacI/PurR family transcriptional regulator/signal transduction histidine kinase
MDFILDRLPRKKDRYTIGFLDENAYDEYHSNTTDGIYEAARRYNLNVIRFGHFAAHITSGNDMHSEVCLNLIENFELDGLIFLGWARAVRFDSVESFRRRFASIPILSLGASYPGIPGVYFPGDAYLKEIINHLIQVHHFRRIAYIAPFWPDDRSKIYIDTMKENGIYHPELYVSEEDVRDLNVPQRGKKAVSILLDDRRTAFDAIISLFNDETRSLVDELKRRGLSVPGDVAVTSYEDGEVSRFYSPSLTTVYFPWRELGYIACEKMYELLSTGKTQMTAIVPGKVIIRESCGCVPGFVASADIGRVPLSNRSFEEVGTEEFGEISLNIEKEAGCGGIWFDNLMLAFRNDYQNRSGRHFLWELEKQLRDVRHNHRQLTSLITAFRKMLLPYLLPRNGCPDTYMWAENLFHQAQVLLQEKISGAWAQEEIKSRSMYLMLKEISQILITNFTVKTLMDSLEINLPRLGIPGCRIITFGGNDSSFGLPSECTLEFDYDGSRRVTPQAGGPKELKRILPGILFREDRPYLLAAHLLYVADDFIGFALFEPGIMDMRIYQTLAINISTALSGAILFEKLDSSYKRLVEQAHRRGMADVSAGTLHNIGNVLNSLGVTTQVIRKMAASSPISDFLLANQLLERNIGDIERFISEDPKGCKLMQYYSRLGDSFEKLREQLTDNITRLSEKIGLIDGIITAQQNYTGIKSTLEELDIVIIIEDSLKINTASLAKNDIEVVKDYCGPAMIMGQKTKLFHVLTNLFKNAIEAMAGTPRDRRRLVISVEAGKGCKLVRIADTGHGIPREKLESIFAYGFTTKKDGHGFGLHSCANYMTEMEGKIWAESEGAGRGAAFVVQLREPKRKA